MDLETLHHGADASADRQSTHVMHAGILLPPYCQIFGILPLRESQEGMEQFHDVVEPQDS